MSQASMLRVLNAFINATVCLMYYEYICAFHWNSSTHF